MLGRIEIENFMSLRSTSVDLEPLTLFVGRNASGKSAVFKALVTLSRFLTGAPLRSPKGEFTLEEGVTLDDLVWRGNSGLPIRFRLWFDRDVGPDPAYELELAKRAEGWGVARECIRVGGTVIEVDETHPFTHETESFGTVTYRPPLRACLRTLVHRYMADSVARPKIEPIFMMSELIGQTWRYRPSASDIAAFVKPPSQPGHRTYVRENGHGVALELQALQGSDRQTFAAIEAELIRLFPHIRAIGFKTDWQGVRLIYSTTRSEDPIPAPQESDGVLLATFLLWRIHTAGAGVRVCLEEPENGLHPDLVGERYELLRSFAYAQNGSPSVQVLVATHSDEALRVIKAHPSKLHSILRGVAFDPTRGTEVTKFAHYPDTARFAARMLEGDKKRPPEGDHLIDI